MDVIDWMLDADPAIRWQMRRDVLQESGGEVAADRDRVATEGVGARILELQSDDGYWNGQEYGENGDRRSVIWSLSLLRRRQRSSGSIRKPALRPPSRLGRERRDRRPARARPS